MLKSKYFVQAYGKNFYVIRTVMEKHNVYANIVNVPPSKFFID